MVQLVLSFKEVINYFEGKISWFLFNQVALKENVGLGLALNEG